MKKFPFKYTKPTTSQYSSWKLPSKLSYLSFLLSKYSFAIAIISLFITIYGVRLSSEPDISRRYTIDILEDFTVEEREIFLRMHPENNSMPEKMYSQSVRPKFAQFGLTYTQPAKVEGFLNVKLTDLGKQAQNMYYEKH